MIDAHQGTEAEIREKRLIKLKAELAAALPSDIFEAALKRGVSRDLNTTARELLQIEWGNLSAEQRPPTPD
jgi:hypothetical protein